MHNFYACPVRARTSHAQHQPYHCACTMTCRERLWLPQSTEMWLYTNAAEVPSGRQLLLMKYRMKKRGEASKLISTKSHCRNYMRTNLYSSGTVSTESQRFPFRSFGSAHTRSHKTRLLPTRQRTESAQHNKSLPAALSQSQWLLHSRKQQG